MAVRELSCAELVELVTDYLEGRMPEVARARFDAHLDRCQGCRNYVEQIRGTVRLAGRLGEDDLTPEGRDRLLAAFRGWTVAR
jgi:predicted anti-sigma-YlaC factor YlaD